MVRMRHVAAEKGNDACSSDSDKYNEITSYNSQHRSWKITCMVPLFLQLSSLKKINRRVWSWRSPR